MNSSAQIVILEDDAVIAVHLEQLLQQRGYRVVGIFASGEEAVGQVKKLRPDVILMDIHLRGKMSGVEASLEIRAELDIPVVFLTAYADEKILNQALFSQPYGYLTKPVREKELVAAIEVALYKHQVDRRLHHLNQVLHAVREVGRLITRQSDPVQLIEEACQVLFQARDFRLVWISKIESGAFKFLKGAGDQHGFLDRLESLHKQEIRQDSPLDMALRTAQPVVSQDISADPDFAAWIDAGLSGAPDEQLYSSAAVIPMRYTQNFFGLLCVLSDLPSAFDHEEVSLLQDLANDLAYALNNIHEEIQRKQAEKLIRRNEASLQSMYLISQFQAGTEVGYLEFVLHEAIQLTESSFGAMKIFDAPPEDSLIFALSVEQVGRGMSLAGLAEALKRSGLWSGLAQLQKTEICNAFSPALAGGQLAEPAWEDGLVISRYLAVPVCNADSSIAVVVIGNKLGDYDDIDTQQISQLMDAVWKNIERNRAILALKRSEERYRLVSEFTYDWEYWINPAGLWIYSSPSCERLTGYASQQFLSDKNFLFNIIHPDDQKFYYAHHELAFRGQVDISSIDFRIIRSDGVVRWISHNCQPVFDSAGNYLGIRASNRDIHNRVEMDEALRQSERRYRHLFENMTSAFALHEIILDDAGLPIDYSFIEMNPAFERLTGLKADNLIGRRVKEVLPDTESYWIETYGWVALSGESIRFENFSREVGRYFDLLAFCPMQGQFAVIFNDITERKQAELLVQRRVAELEVLHENSLAISRLLEPKEIGEKITDILSRKLEWNHATVRAYNADTGVLEMLALHRNQIESRELAEDFSRLNSAIQKSGQGLSGWVVQHCQTVRSGDVKSDERYLQTFPDICSGLYVPIKAGETIIGVISVESVEPDAFDAEDERLLTTVAAQAAIALENARLFQSGQAELAERRRAEEALRLLNQELEQRVNERTRELRSANAELERASRLKDEFLASMSHELRTPLTGVLNLSEALQEQVYGPLTEKQFKSLRTIEDSGRHLLGLINDILDLSKIEAGQFKLQLEECYVSDICQSSLQMVRGMAQKKQHNLSFTLKPTDMELWADPRRLKQILVNLLSNAVKFTPEGGEIGLEVIGDEQKQVVTFAIWDKGIGISEADQQRLFKPFTQLDSSLSRQQSGTGLGLILVQRMADLHGGSVQVESVAGQGSRFTIMLPWAKADAVLVGSDPGIVFNPLDMESAKKCQDMSVLLVDDNANNITVYSDYLQAKGYVVLAAASGLQGVLLAHEEHPDLILMDIQMPGIDGVEAIRRIRASQDDWVAHIPVIALTALAMPGDKERCLEAGANDYLSKPVSLQTLIRTVEAYCFRSN